MGQRSDFLDPRHEFLSYFMPKAIVEQRTQELAIIFQWLEGHLLCNLIRSVRHT